MTRKSSIFVALFSIASVGLVYRAASDSATTLSPQGCRMSYMSPSYLVQSQFDTSWTPLAKRYSLLLYREVGWEDNQSRGVPVLFIPGNAGSAHQIRSIASSAARQYYASPYTSSPEFTSRAIQPLDFFAVDYNEDLSAFHGPTLDVETAYASSAISYILSLYPPDTSIVVMGHSMGGVVATSILPSPNISAVITMSTPHQLPPARFDRRIAAIYNSNRAALATANTPILSLCGGAADLMVPSESCILPEAADVGVYRRTIFSSALEGCWTGVGHQVVVWCHQVRWRVARAALELGSASTSAERSAILDRWLRDGRSPPPALGYPTPLHLNQVNYTVLPPGPVILRALREPGAVHLAPVPETGSPTKFVAYVSEGSVLSIGPYHASSLSVSFHLCLSKTDDASPSACEELHPSSLKLIPNPSFEKPFPVPHEGVDESEGVVAFEATLPERTDGEHRWVAIAYSTNEERGWILGGFVEEPTVMKFSVHDLLYKCVTVPVNPNNVHSDIRLPSLLSNALVVYRVGATYASDQRCDNPLLTPLLEHTSPSEAHFYPLTHARPLLLHTHSGAPFTSHPHTRGLNLTLYASPDCKVASLHLRVDWRGSLGRAGARYWTAVPGWAVGVVAWMLFSALGEYERGAPTPSVSDSLSVFTRVTLPRLLGATFAISLLPLPRDYALGNGGEIVFAPLAPLVLLIATGLVTVSWWVLCITMWPIRKAGRVLARRKADAGITRNTVLSMLLVLLLVALVVPWQVAFLGCWSIHLVTCATHVPAPPGDAPTPQSRSRSPTPDHRPAIPPVPRPQSSVVPHDAEHVLLLLTWLLPLAAPVLAVWARTLATAGLEAASAADHGVWSVAPYLVLVDFASWTRDALFLRDRVEFVSARWGLLPPAVVAFLRGARHTYEVFDWVWGAVAVLVVLRVGPRYWGVPSWSSVLGSRAQSPS
ncbi:PGAP1-like protein-domain-containing protein [Lactarius deliciosus]|nr:PGAP1-like protein-domain-containing protein [Lactarius deliciosus]